VSEKVASLMDAEAAGEVHEPAEPAEEAEEPENDETSGNVSDYPMEAPPPASYEGRGPSARHPSRGYAMDGYAECATQTPEHLFSPWKVVMPEGSRFQDPHGPTLLREYHKAVANYIENVNISDLSQLRGEICQRTQNRATYQLTSYGSVSIGLDEPPPNLFSTFTVSLYLVIHPDGRFNFSTPDPGIGITGLIDEDEGRSLLFYISRGFLRPGLLQPLLELGLTWYDGCLICEVIDNRRQLGRTIRTQLRVAQEDVVSFGVDSEQQLLLAQYPFLCLDPSPQVGNLARLAVKDRQRWEPQAVEGESKMMFVARRNPEVFFMAETRPEPPKISQEEEDKFRREMIKKLLAGRH
jgi:hypothetical protein